MDRLSQTAALPGRLGVHTSTSRRRAWSSTITLKLVMAISGLLFIAFVLGHVYGNLKAFSGHDAYNEYAEHLRTLGEPIFPRSGLLWIMRVGLIAALVAHVSSAIVLARRARRARGRYAARPPRRASSLASRTMLTGGLGLFLFLGWHLVNFTIGKVNVRGGPTNDPFNLVVDTFSVWWSTALYLAAMLVLGMHLWHGTWSSLQTLGWTVTAKRRQAAKATAMAVAVLVAGGFSLSPIAIQFGLIGP